MLTVHHHFLFAIYKEGERFIFCTCPMLWKHCEDRPIGQHQPFTLPNVTFLYPGATWVESECRAREQSQAKTTNQRKWIFNLRKHLLGHEGGFSTKNCSVKNCVSAHASEIFVERILFYVLWKILISECVILFVCLFPLKVHIGGARAVCGTLVFFYFQY